MHRNFHKWRYHQQYHLFTYVMTSRNQIIPKVSRNRFYWWLKIGNPISDKIVELIGTDERAHYRYVCQISSSLTFFFHAFSMPSIERLNQSIMAREGNNTRVNGTYVDDLLKLRRLSVFFFASSIQTKYSTTRVAWFFVSGVIDINGRYST